jgi:hypothetical protein
MKYVISLKYNYYHHVIIITFKFEFDIPTVTVACEKSLKFTHTSFHIASIMITTQ